MDALKTSSDIRTSRGMTAKTRSARNASFDPADSRFCETSPYSLDELLDLHPEWFEGDPRLEPLLVTWRALRRP